MEQKKKNSATDPEPPPTGQGKDVTAALIKDLEDRSEMGLEKYGTVLRTNNGRDPMVDAYQELLDLAKYFKQELMEREERQVAFDWLEESGCDLCSVNIPTGGGDYSVHWEVKEHYLGHVDKVIGRGKSPLKAIADAQLPEGHPDKWDYVPEEYRDGKS